MVLQKLKMFASVANLFKVLTMTKGWNEQVW